MFTLARPNAPIASWVVLWVFMSSLVFFGVATAVEPTHWAFRTLARRQPPPPPPPPVTLSPREAARLRTEIDAWTIRPLVARQLSFNPDVRPELWIRRLAFDLTGLPPTLEILDEYSDETSPDALERLTDRYLASPRFGERWGKHWLDLSGYADSNGYFSADTDRPLAYRYRDYVVRSVNHDKPFATYLREQLAGDELAGFRAELPATPAMIELLEATHFLRNGQDGSDIGVMEPEAQTVDRRAALEAVVQVTTSSLLGLTVHCARCHDHKFEPISQEEYYQLQAVLFPAFNPNDWILPKDRTIYAYLPGEKETWEANERRLSDELAAARREFVEWSAAHREQGELLWSDDFEGPQAHFAARWSSTASGDNQPSGLIVLDGEGASAARVLNGALQIHAGGSGESWLATQATFPWAPAEENGWIQVTFDLVDHHVGTSAPAERIGYTIAAVDFHDDGPTDGGNLLIDGNPGAATNVYRDYPGPDQKVIGTIGKQGYVPGHNYGVRITNLGGATPKYRLEHLVDWLPDGATIEVTSAELPTGSFAFFYCNNRSYIVDNVRIERSRKDASADAQVTKQREELRQRRDRYEARRKELESQRSPQPGRAIAWVSDKSATAPQVPFLKRGQYDAPGAPVQPAGLGILSAPGQELRVQPPSSGAPTTGHRLAFAEWLTRADGRAAALVARVHVNRIWRQYFGRGIVTTTDNLGESGAVATHPELLEQLARQFVDSDWSQKQLHRALVTSTIYRQSAAPQSDGLKQDANNQNWWRWSLRRLDAEMLRDAMLAASGELDLTAGGPYVPTKQTSVGEVVTDNNQPGAARRSLYLQQRRSQTLSLLKVFDAPALSTICTSRPASSVPLQSLALLNSDFTLARADALALRVAREAGDAPAAAVTHAWRLVVGRAPSDTQRNAGVAFLAAQVHEYTDPKAAHWALADYCQMLLSSNAFLYLE